MECRIGCGACCVELSISSPIPGMPNGKPAGVTCVQLTLNRHCLLFGLPERPAVCVRFRARRDTCGHTQEFAVLFLAQLEQATKPGE